jgi:23S rRNA (guanosine2251-2'-O)-methyltransferase
MEESVVPDEQDYIWGRHPVEEALTGGGRVRRILIAQGAREAGLAHLLALAEAQRIAVASVPRARLDQIARGASHQGVIASVEPWRYHDLGDLLATAGQRREPPLLLALDSVQDVHNLGALIRTAEAVGAHGIIIPQHRAASVTPAVVKSSAGAIEHLAVSRVTNLPRALDELKAQGVWAIGLAGEAGQSIEAVDLNLPLALVVGSEGAGIGRLVRERCDLLVRLPMRGHVNSLNAAVAGSIALYAAWRARENA